MAKISKKGNECHCFAQTHGLKAGLKDFGKKGKGGAREEFKRMSERTAWKSVRPSDLTKDDKRKDVES